MAGNGGPIMTTTTATKAQILELAKKLPYDERWELVEELEATLHPPPPDPPMTDAEFRAELDRRWDEYKSGKVQMVTWDEVKTELRRDRDGHG
jgi:putative addiction module component (TIGR02574 family)